MLHSLCLNFVIDDVNILTLLCHKEIMFIAEYILQFLLEKERDEES